MPIIHNHTHLQATQSSAQTKAYKRVCLPISTKTLHTRQERQLTERSAATNPTLPNIENELKRIHKKDFLLNSFILLRDSSELGKLAKPDWKKNNMISKNILRLDWHNQDEKENNADQTKLVDNNTYLDWIIEKTI